MTRADQCDENCTTENKVDCLEGLKKAIVVSSPGGGKLWTMQLLSIRYKDGCLHLGRGLRVNWRERLDYLGLPNFNDTIAIWNFPLHAYSKVYIPIVFCRTMQTSLLSYICLYSCHTIKMY